MISKQSAWFKSLTPMIIKTPVVSHEIQIQLQNLAIWTLLADGLVVFSLKVFFPGYIDDDSIIYLFIASFLLWAWDCKKKD